MLSLENINQQASHCNNVDLGRLFSVQMLECAKIGNINFFREVYDNLDDETEENLWLCYTENPDLHRGEITLDKIFRTLVETSIREYNESILNYFITENRYFRQRQHAMSDILFEEIKICIYSNIFDFAKKLIDATNSVVLSNNYTNFMYELILEDSIPRIEFMIQNFDFFDSHKFNFILYAIKMQKLTSLKYLKSTIEINKNEEMQNNIKRRKTNN